MQYNNLNKTGHSTQDTLALKLSANWKTESTLFLAMSQVLMPLQEAIPQGTESDSSD